MSIKENIEHIKVLKAEAARKIGKNPEDVLLVAVTKTYGAEKINEAIDAGIKDIGENKVQEILDKYENVKPVKWHMIGHLQTNKVKYIIDKVSMIHSVDSLKLAEEINKRAAKIGIVMDILLQINPAMEESKFGITSKETGELLCAILETCTNVRVCGLMSIVPYDENPENVRKYFAMVKNTYDKFKDIEHNRMEFKYLSMGMSHDFQTAIEEGANLIRVGTAIFGNRDYSKQ
ncbi:MAG: YggS family pyridoxal phosphate-dependent enzyme [Peptostreptococcaceae bacterium]|nr:YggS family pyridoxal phosphate-dependent enzyme [Peptostreptococcaceae bacterium]